MTNKLCIPARTLIFIGLFALFARPAEAGKAFGDYPDLKGMYEEIYKLEKDFPGNAKVIEYGRSVQGRPLLAVRISLDLADTKPAAAVSGNIHGNEWIGNRVAMGVARRLLEGRESDAWITGLLGRVDFYVLPCLNPDGYFKTESWLTKESMPARVARKNAHGVDINRNFPLPATRTVNIEMAGSADPDSERYTGPSPYSEPESAAIRDFFAARTIFAAVDLHSNWGTIFPPKCNSGKCEAKFKKMCAAAAGKQAAVKYPCVIGRHVDSFSGEMEDALFYDFGVMAVCWEVFTQAAGQDQEGRLKNPFWAINPVDIQMWVDNDRDGILAAIDAAYDITGGKPIPPELRKVEGTK